MIQIKCGCFPQELVIQKHKQTNNYPQGIGTGKFVSITFSVSDLGERFLAPLISLSPGTGALDSGTDGVNNVMECAPSIAEGNLEPDASKAVEVNLSQVLILLRCETAISQSS